MAVLAESVQSSATAHARGVRLVLAAGILWSTIGLGIRLLDGATPFQVVFYRAAGQVPIIMAMLLVRYRADVVKSFHRVGLTGVVGGIMLALSYTSAMYSLQNTTIASAVFVMSSAPLLAGLLGYLILREHVKRLTWVAMIVALGGVLIMLDGARGAGQLGGNLAAFAAAFFYAGFTVALRRGKNNDMLPVIALSGVFAMVIAAFAADDLAVTQHDLAIMLFLGAVAMAIGLALFTAGSRHLTAAELPLIAMGETVLTPVWVWLFVGESINATTFVGGLIILGGVLVQAYFGSGRRLIPRGYTS